MVADRVGAGGDGRGRCCGSVIRMHSHGRKVVAKAGLKVTKGGFVEWMTRCIEDAPDTTRWGRPSKERRRPALRLGLCGLAPPVRWESECGQWRARVRLYCPVRRKCWDAAKSPGDAARCLPGRRVSVADLLLLVTAPWHLLDWIVAQWMRHRRRAVWRQRACRPFTCLRLRLSDLRSKHGSSSQIARTRSAGAIEARGVMPARPSLPRMSSATQRAFRPRLPRV
jgi:hypothetical protein